MLSVFVKHKHNYFYKFTIMFTLLRNLEIMFLNSIFSQLEGNLWNYDTNRDGDLSATEASNLLSEKVEAKRALELTEVETLEAAVELAYNIDFADGLNTIEQKTIQYLSAKALKLQWDQVNDGSIDGKIGVNSLKDLNTVTGLDLKDASEIKGKVLQILISKVNTVIWETKQKLSAAEAAEAVEKNAAEVTLAQYADIEAIKGLASESDDAKEVQSALNTLGFNAWLVDGKIGPKSIAAYTAYIEEFAEANKTPEELQKEHALKALDAVKKDPNAVKAIQEAVWAGVDGKSGPKTRKAVEANPNTALIALAAYIDTTDDASVSKRMSTEKPSQGDVIESELEAIMNGKMTPQEKKAFAEKFTGDVDSHTRNANAQYVALWLQENGFEDNTQAGIIMEAIMAEWKGHYEQNTVELQLREALEDGSGRFAEHLGRFPENFSGSYYKIRQTLQSAGGRTRVENGMETGMSGTATEITRALFGVDADYLATRAHILTGQGKDGSVDMSLEIANGIQLSNAYYDAASGAIYAVVAKGNGCEGNLVVIPVETFLVPKPKPKWNVPRRWTPKMTTTQITEESHIVPEPEECEKKYWLSYVDGQLVWPAYCDPQVIPTDDPENPENPIEWNKGQGSSPRDWAPVGQPATETNF